MSTLTPNYKLEKPESTDYYDVNVQNRNWEKIDSELKHIDEKKADLGENGKIPFEQLPPMNYDPAGSAAAVQKNLDAHTSNKKNPHGVTADQVGADPKGSANAVKQSLEAHTGNKQNPHGVTAAQVGTYSKEQALSSATAALFGLGTDAVPDDALRLLGRFNSGLGNEYLWAKCETDFIEQLGEEISKSGAFKGYSFQYADSVSYQNGKVVLNNPTSATIPGVTSSGETGYQKYIVCNQMVGSDDVVYVTSYSGSGSTHYYKYKPVTFVETTGSLSDYLNSPNENAYPPEEPDDYTYVPLGKLGGFSHIISGSYAGTGLYGIDNPNTIVFSSAPKLVVITGNGLNHNAFILLYTGGDTSFSGHTGGSVSDTYQTIVDKSKSFTWYGNNITQMNSLGVIYTYTAVL